MDGQRLVLAEILQDAIDAFSRRGRAVERDEARAREAETWLFSEDRATPNSFRNVCDVLDLDAGRIRDLLLRWRHANSATDALIRS